MADKKPSQELETLMQKRSDLNTKKYNLERELRKLEKEIKDNSALIMKTCVHNWVRDTAYYGPYEKPDNICTICNSIHYRF